ncbi:hypothetical protein S83_023651, partial [Arachis hypogaea]
FSRYVQIPLHWDMYAKLVKVQVPGREILPDVADVINSTRSASNIVFTDAVRTL